MKKSKFKIDTFVDYKLENLSSIKGGEPGPVMSTGGGSTSNGNGGGLEPPFPTPTPKPTPPGEAPDLP